MYDVKSSEQRCSILNLGRIVQVLELVQDLIVICLCIGLYSASWCFRSVK